MGVCLDLNQKILLTVVKVMVDVKVDVPKRARPTSDPRALQDLR